MRTWRCEPCDEEIVGYDITIGILTHLFTHIHTIEGMLMTLSDNQAHLDQDVNAIGSQFAIVIQELKDAANAGQPLDFTKADALVQTVTTEATADAPATPSQPVDAGSGDATAAPTS